jgi:flavodoxin
MPTNEAQSKPVPRQRRVLVAYFSHTGNTRELARQIHEAVGGDLFEIQPEKPYPDEYNAVVQQAKVELQSDYKPKLKTRVKNMESYDVVFIGSPNWWNTVAGPVRAFLSEYDMSGKTIVPFMTHGGNGLGRSVKDVSKLCPKSTVLEGLAILGTEVKTSQDQVADWLRKLKIPESRDHISGGSPAGAR